MRFEYHYTERFAGKQHNTIWIYESPQEQFRRQWEHKTTKEKQQAIHGWRPLNKQAGREKNKNTDRQTDRKRETDRQTTQPTDRQTCLYITCRDSGPVEDELAKGALLRSVMEFTRLAQCAISKSNKKHLIWTLQCWLHARRGRNKEMERGRLKEQQPTACWGSLCVFCVTVYLQCS